MVAIVLLVVMGAVGSFDGIYYHLYKFRLYSLPGSRLETVTHLLRAATYALALGLLVHFRPEGAWYWAVAAIFALDFAIDVADVLLEPKSRAPLGGLPPLEYLIHMIVMALSGGIWASFLIEGWPLRAGAGGLVARASGELPTGWLWAGRVFAASAVLNLVYEATLLVRAARRQASA